LVLVVLAQAMGTLEGTAVLVQQSELLLLLLVVLVVVHQPLVRMRFHHLMVEAVVVHNHQTHAPKLEKHSYLLLLVMTVELPHLVLVVVVAVQVQLVSVVVVLVAVLVVLAWMFLPLLVDRLYSRLVVAVVGAILLVLAVHLSVVLAVLLLLVHLRQRTLLGAVAVVGTTLFMLVVLVVQALFMFDGR
jgi:hypothetical protein